MYSYHNAYVWLEVFLHKYDLELKSMLVYTVCVCLERICVGIHRLIGLMTLCNTDTQHYVYSNTSLYDGLVPVTTWPRLGFQSLKDNNVRFISNVRDQNKLLL